MLRKERTQTMTTEEEVNNNLGNQSSLEENHISNSKFLTENATFSRQTRLSGGGNGRNNASEFISPFDSLTKIQYGTLEGLHNRSLLDGS